MQRCRQAEDCVGVINSKVEGGSQAMFTMPVSLIYLRPGVSKLLSLLAMSCFSFMSRFPRLSSLSVQVFFSFFHLSLLSGNLYFFFCTRLFAFDLSSVWLAKIFFPSPVHHKRLGYVTLEQWFLLCIMSYRLLLFTNNAFFSVTLSIPLTFLCLS